MKITLFTLFNLALLHFCSAQNSHLQQSIKDLDNGNYTVAIARLDSIISAEPNDTMAYYYRGKGYVLRSVFKNANDKDYRQAIASFTEYIKLKPADPRGYYYRATAIQHLVNEFGPKPSIYSTVKPMDKSESLELLKSAQDDTQKADQLGIRKQITLEFDRLQTKITELQAKLSN